MCHLCEYNTDVLYLYRQHLTFHTGFKYQIQGSTLESKNKCGYCGYISTSNKEFDMHMEKHLNSRPFNCPYCPFSQYTQATVKYHIQNIHPDKKVEVIKDSSSSFLTGDGKVPKVMLVNFEPNIKLNDIFAMESGAFEDLLITSNVSVIDLHSIPDDQFGNVSKLLGVNGDEEASEPDNKPQLKRNNSIVEETEDDDLDDEVDGDPNIEIDERNYSDVSDDEQQVPDDESHPSENELSDQEEDEGGRDDDDTNDKTDVEFDDAVSEKQGRQSTTEYEDISDVEMDSENSTIYLRGEKMIVKSELTYEDISDDDTL